MELDSPITIYWDLPSGHEDTRFLQRICSDILECRPLMLQISDPGPLLRESTVAVLEKFSGSFIAVTLTIPPAAIPEEGWGRLHSTALREILLDVDSVDSLPAGVGALLPKTGISFRVTAANWNELPTLVTYCREERVSRLVLPMQRLYAGEAPFFIAPEEQRELADSLAFVGGVEGMEITIHDPFLWRAFNPGVPFPQGGCQAANTMMAIAPDGVVYPCPALPVPLGRIGDSSLKEIVASRGKREFRRGLLEYPSQCRGCPEIDVCKGGCRGRGHVIHGSLDGIDPACK
jgi:GeoRSP system SPASM domain protein